MGLSDLRSRARELRRTLDELARVLASRPEALLWGDVLEKFCVAGVQASALSARCRASAGGLASAYALHPSSVNELNAASLPVMLSTAPLPEAVAERARRVEEAVEALLIGGGGGGGGDDGGGGGATEAKTTTAATTETETATTLERLGAAADSVNSLVDFLTVSPSSSSSSSSLGEDGAPSLKAGLLDPKSAERRSLAAEAHALAAPPPPPPPRGVGAAKGKPGGALSSSLSVPEDPKEALVSRALAGRLV